MKANVYHIDKAAPIGNVKPKNVKIIISDVIHTFDNIEEAEQFYQDQAEQLAGILFSSLPQGTLDRFLIVLMQRKLSLYRGLTD